MNNDLISRRVLLDRLRGNVLIDVTSELEKEIEEQPVFREWIPCKERLPEEKINPITKDFCEYQVTFQSGDVKDIRHYKFGRGHWWNCGEKMDDYVIAWQPLSKPYQEVKDNAK